MFGHGFLPRVTDKNRAGVARALSPSDLLGGDPPPVPWVVVDGPSANADPTLAAGLRDHGCSRLVDTQAWRFGLPLTWEMPKWTSLPYTPPSPYDATELWVRRYVRDDLRFQATAGG